MGQAVEIFYGYLTINVSAETSIFPLDKDGFRAKERTSNGYFLRICIASLQTDLCLQRTIHHPPISCILLLQSEKNHHKILRLGNEVEFKSSRSKPFALKTICLKILSVFNERINLYVLHTKLSEKEWESSILE